MKSLKINFWFQTFKTYEKTKKEKKDRHELNVKYKKNILTINDHNFFVK